ncbi:SRPBCC family protein [Micropruina sp.]|uniref:SRPBCC family protein n=1 Tax=Micropruina sp. TaxID=2737536 RepID=UPI0039E5205D
MSDDFAELLRRGPGIDVELRRSFPSPAVDVWDALVTPERLARWLAPVSGDLSSGGRFRVDFDADDAAQQVNGTITECDPPLLLALTWEIQDAGVSTVTATLTDTQSGCELLLRHCGLSEPMAAGYGAGWHAYADALAAELAGGSVPDWDERWTELFPEYRRRAEAAG